MRSCVQAVAGELRTSSPRTPRCSPRSARSTTPAATRRRASRSGTQHADHRGLADPGDPRQGGRRDDAHTRHHSGAPAERNHVAAATGPHARRQAGPYVERCREPRTCAQGGRARAAGSSASRAARTRRSRSPEPTPPRRRRSSTASSSGGRATANALILIGQAVSSQQSCDRSPHAGTPRRCRRLRGSTSNTRPQQRTAASVPALPRPHPFR
jgi:hypothetical protein